MVYYALHIVYHHLINFLDLKMLTIITCWLVYGIYKLKSGFTCTQGEIYDWHLNRHENQFYFCYWQLYIDMFKERNSPQIAFMNMVV